MEFFIFFLNQNDFLVCVLLLWVLCSTEVWCIYYRNILSVNMRNAFKHINLPLKYFIHELWFTAILNAPVWLFIINIKNMLWSAYDPDLELIVSCLNVNFISRDHMFSLYFGLILTESKVSLTNDTSCVHNS